MKNLEIISLLKTPTPSPSLQISTFKDGEFCFKLHGNLYNKDIVVLQVS